MAEVEGREERRWKGRKSDTQSNLVYRILWPFRFQRRVMKMGLNELGMDLEK